MKVLNIPIIILEEDDAQEKTNVVYQQSQLISVLEQLTSNNEIPNLQATNKDLLEQLEIMRNEVADKDKCISELNTEVSNLQNALESSMSDCAQAKSDVYDVNAKLAQCTLRNYELNEKLLEDANKENKTIVQQAQQIRVFQQQRDELQAILINMQQQNEVQQQKLVSKESNEEFLSDAGDQHNGKTLKRPCSFETEQLISKVLIINLNDADMRSKDDRKSLSFAVKSSGEATINDVSGVEEVQVKHVCSMGCGKTFSTQNNMRRHVEEQHEGNGTECPHCQKFFKRKQNLKEHIKKTHSMETKTISPEEGNPSSKNDS